MGALALRSLPRPLLAKHREQDGSLACRQVVRNASPLAAQIEAQLPQFAAKLARVRLVEQRPALGQQVDVERDMTEPSFCKAPERL